MKENIKKRWGLTVSLVLFVFAIIVATMMFAGLMIFLLHLAGKFPFLENEYFEQASGGWRVILVLMFISTLLGTAIAAFFSKKALKPIRRVIDATHRIAEGDFNVRVELKGVYELEELSRSFNKMAHELSTIETLRGDFVNNFSHEFKTPIVSIRGFAKLLKNGNLTEDEKQEYLDIIITESERLAALSTNVLNLSKYENIEIISDKTLFQLDEQIRRAVVMTEPKWSAKNINLNVEMDEILFEGNEDLTQQIWLNLLDNAIKFSDINGEINIWLSKWNGGVLFSIQDNGTGMDENIKTRIFDKFYQGDNSRAQMGNGLGLAIIKRITELCGGRLEVQSKPGEGSTFSIFLPN